MQYAPAVLAPGAGGRVRHVGARFIDNGNTQALPACTVFDATRN